MHDSVPFDPPYVKKISSQDGERWVEVQINGTEVACEAPVTLHSSASEKARQPFASTASKAPKGTILNVPYAEKEDAKRLGAKWDATRKKWYVPPGLDTEPFSRWATGA
jgi:hypothetical protein